MNPPRTSTPASRIVSYLIVSGGGALGGFLLALCSIGGTARYPKSMLASDAVHGAWILAFTVAGGAVGFFGVWRALKKRSE